MIEFGHMKLCRTISLTLAAFGICCQLSAQEPDGTAMTLEEAVGTARMQSVAALQARRAFISTYWAWRSYRASRLPSLTLYGGLLNYNHSLTLLQSYEDGSLRYASASNLQNSLGLRISQNLPFTGGTVSLYSDLSRIDQFGAGAGLTWYSQPVTISYAQPLFAYNRFKWEKKIEPKAYERGKRTYLESMEQVTLDVVDAYFNLLQAEKALEVARTGCENTVKMCAVAKERLTLGSVTRDEYLQLELRMLGDSIRVSEGQVEVRKARMTLNSVMGLDETTEVRPLLEDILPAVDVDYDMAISKAMDNSTFPLDNEISILSAESAVEQAKADRGITMSFNARFGLSRNAPDFLSAYRNPLDQEVAGLSFSVPIFDWGLGKGKVQKAKANEEVVRAQVLQKENDFRRTLFTAVGQFSTLRGQCAVSRRSMEIAAERYALVLDKFRSGRASVTDLTNAQNDNEAAAAKYISDVSAFWRGYYTLRKYTLYDFIGRKDLEINVEEMVEP